MVERMRGCAGDGRRLGAMRAAAALKGCRIIRYLVIEGRRDGGDVIEASRGGGLNAAVGRRRAYAASVRPLALV